MGAGICKKLQSLKSLNELAELFSDKRICKNTACETLIHGYVYNLNVDEERVELTLNPSVNLYRIGILIDNTKEPESIFVDGDGYERTIKMLNGLVVHDEPERQVA